MAKITEEDIYCMKASVECLPGLVAYAFDNYDILTKKDQDRLVGNCTKFMTEIDQILKTINDNNVGSGGEAKMMCWDIVINMDDAANPLDMDMLELNDVSRATKIMYKPVPISWLGRTIRELNNYMSIYIPDPRHNLTPEEALKQAIEAVNDYIIMEKCKWKEWMRGRDYGDK